MSVRAVSCLRELASFYRGFLLDLGGLCDVTNGGLRQHLPRASALQCIQELLGRGKKIAVVQNTPSRASTLAGIARKGGIPENVVTWTSGEFVYQNFASMNQSMKGNTAERLSTAAQIQWPSSTLQLPVARGSQPLRVFELSALAKPRRWSDLASRGDPPLKSLGRSRVIKRVSALEEADICYWDAHEGDDLGAFLEAAVELCFEFKVPLLHASRSAQAAQALIGSAPKGSAEATAATLERLGGQTLAVCKLDGCARGIAWEEDVGPRDVLLVTEDLGDIVDAASHGIDALLLLGTRAEAQLAGFQHVRSQERVAKRQHMSINQRLAEDSPAMLHAAANPFLTVFKLPSLIAEAKRKNSEHRARLERATAAATATESVRGPSAVHNELKVDSLELLKEWCEATRVPLPYVLTCSLRWDVSQDNVRTSLSKHSTSQSQQPRPATPTLPDSLPNKSPFVAASHGTTAKDGPAKKPDNESLDDLLQKLGASGGKHN